MKKILSLALCLLSCGVFAQTIDLQVFSENGERFWVIINGAKQNAQAAQSVKVPQLKGDFLKLKVVFENQALPELTKTIGLPPDVSHQAQTYRIKQTKKGKYVLRLFDASDTVEDAPPVVAQNPTPQQGAPNTPHQNAPDNSTTVMTTKQTVGDAPAITSTQQVKVEGENVRQTSKINAGGEELITESKGGENGMQSRAVINGEEMMNVKADATGVRVKVGGKDDGIDVGFDMGNLMSGGDLLSGGRSDNEPRKQTPARPNSPTPAKPASGCHTPMYASDFSQAIGKIRNIAFESSKLEDAKAVTSKNCLSVEQIAQIAALFSMDDTKYDYITYAHKYCVDKNNYHSLGNSLTYSSNKDKFNKFLQDK